MTAVEVLVCFVLVVIICVSMYTTVSAYQNKQQIEAAKEKIVTYKNLITKEINDDLIKKGLVSANIILHEGNVVTGSESYIEMNLRNGEKKCLEIKSQKAYDYLWDPTDSEMVSQFPAAEDKDDNFIIFPILLADSNNDSPNVIKSFIKKQVRDLQDNKELNHYTSDFRKLMKCNDTEEPGVIIETWKGYSSHIENNTNLKHALEQIGIFLI